MKTITKFCKVCGHSIKIDVEERDTYREELAEKIDLCNDHKKAFS
jgi:hypothetical protein